MKRTSMQTTLKLAAATLLAIPTIASATVLATNSFEDNTLGALSGQGGGLGWTGNWTAPGNVTRADVVDTTSSPLLYAIPGGAVINGETKALEVALTGAAASQLCGVRALATPIADTFYVGYLVRYVGSGTWAAANNTFTLHLGTNASQTAVLNFGLRGDNNAANNEFIIRYGTGSPVAGASTGGQLTNNTSYYLVARVNYSGGVCTNANLWLNPSFTDDVDTPNGDASVTNFSFPNPITHVFFRQAVLDANDILQADEIKLGTAWSDVVPSAGPPLAQVGVSTSPSSYIPVTAQTITAGNSITVYAVALDANGNYVGNTPAAWSPINVTGGIAGSDIVPANGGRSAVFTGHLVGSANLRATPPTGATVYNDSGLITVQAAAASQVRVETQADGLGTVVPAQSVAAGGAGMLTAYAISRDPYGNFIGNISATWSLQNKTSGVVNGDLSPTSGTSSTFTGNLSGTANIRASSGALTSVDSGLITVSRAISWVGGGANPWDFTTANWTPDFGGTSTKYLDSDDVTFDWGGSMSPSVNILGTVKPHSVNVTGGPYTIGGAGISGVAALTNSSGTLLTLLNTNDYSGFTVVSLGGTLQLGNGVKNGSLGTGTVRIETGGTSPIFNRTDPVASPYVVSNTVAGPADFIIEVMSGAVSLAGNGVNAKATAVVRTNATLILGKDVGGGAALGNSTAVSGTVLTIDAGGTVKLGSAVTDHITGAGKFIQIEGTFDANGYSEAFGIIQGGGIIDNTAVSNAVLTVNQGATANGQSGEIFTFNGIIRNTGAGLLGLTKDSTNTLILASANTFGGDTRILGGGILELGNANSMQSSTLDYRAGDIGNLSFGTLSAATLGGLKGAKAFGLTNAFGEAVALTIGGNGQANTFSGALSDGGSLTKTGAGIQTMSGTNTHSGATTVSQGTLLVNGGWTASAISVGASGTLGGIGTIGTAVGVSGTLRPGNNAVGKLSVNNTATLSGSTVMEISLTTTTNADQLAATTIALGGNLTVTNVGALTLQRGNAFALFAGGLSGAIAVNSLPPLWPGLSWNTSALNSAGTISVIGTATPPVISSVSTVGGNLTMSGSGGLPGATYYVVSTNNVTVPFVNWPRIGTNVFAADGNFTNTFPANPATPQAYFGIRVP